MRVVGSGGGVEVGEGRGEEGGHRAAGARERQGAQVGDDVGGFGVEGGTAEDLREAGDGDEFVGGAREGTGGVELGEVEPGEEVSVDG